MSRSATHGVMAASYADAIEHCRQICRRSARNFYYGLKLLPEPQRSTLYVIYAWMRRADDLADNVHTATDGDPYQRIEAFRQSTAAALAGDPIDDDPMLQALAEVGRQFRLPSECFHSMLDGQRDDVSKTEYRTFDDLRAYCYRVASTVGLICIEIWGYDDPTAREMAMHRGIAFQLTNILRDYSQDFDAGRVYLPQDEFQEFKLTPAALRRWSDPARCTAMMQHQIARAQAYYQRSAGLERLITPNCRPTVRAMTAIYQGLLHKIEKHPKGAIVGRRVRLSSLQKAYIAIRAKWFATTESANGKPRSARISEKPAAP